MTKKLYTTKRYMVVSLVVLLLATSVVVSSLPFRLYPTHAIVRQVFCISCHAEEFEILKEGGHIRLMSAEQNKTFYDYIDLYGNVSEPAKTLMGPCYTCHVTYESFNLFGLTDPYIYPVGSRTLYTVGNMAVTQTIYDAQYGTIINWPLPFGNRIREYYDGNVAITAELQVLSVEPANSSVISTIKVILSNYSGQQNGSIVCDCTQTLYQGDTLVVTVDNIKNDYFSIILLLDGTWNSSTLNLTVSGTDKGTESFIINVNNPPVIYEIPRDVSGIYYFKTNGIYKAVRLDAIWYAWRNYSVNGNITSSDIIQTSSPTSPTGWINASTCSAPDGMCHIAQKATAIGMLDGTNPDRILYPHKMEFVTSRQCKICHLEGGVATG